MNEASVVTQEQVERWMEELSNWGRWGDTDQLGAANLVTPKKRLEAFALAREGVCVSLARTIDKEKAADNEHAFGQVMELTERGHAMDTYSTRYHGSTTTHVDSLCHYSFQGKLYNGYVRSHEISDAGAKKLGVENLKLGVFTRGIVVDIPRLRGVPYVEPGTEIRTEDLEAWEKHAGITAGPGDALFLRTGRWARRAKVGPWNVRKHAAGYHVSVMPWLKRRDVAFLGTDGVLDVMPSGVEGVPRPVHLVGIVAMGLWIFDCLDLELLAEEAAKRKRWEFFLATAPIPVPGGTGSPLNPIAMF